jgi:HAD superfamily hydrolase (TIGR01509 family)
LALSRAALRQYRLINEELWVRYRRGELTQPVLALERFRRLLLFLEADPRRAAGLGRAYLDQLSERGDRLPGCRPTLARLQARYRLGVVTNGIDRVQRARLRAARLESFFQVVVTSEACGFAKPDPRILGVALDALGVAPAQALYVGDDVGTDGGAAASAGVPFCWMDRGQGHAPGSRPPRRRVRSLLELAELLPQP